MLVVKLEVWPGGDKSRARRIGQMQISNKSDLTPFSAYTARIVDAKGVVLATGMYVYEHARAAGAWRLVQSVLAEVPHDMWRRLRWEP